MKIVAIAVGGAVGALLRYGSSLYVNGLMKGMFPWGTLFVNITGSFIIGLLWSVSEEVYIYPPLKDLVFIGLLGAFTTFSTYSLETVNLIKYREYKMAALYVLAGNIIGILTAFGGYYLSKAVLRIK